MSISFLGSNIWPELTAEAKASVARCHVAVAFLSRGESRKLPLPAGSVLVVNAADETVRGGLTSPADLLKLVKRGVVVYSVPNLHAKVFVFGRTAYVGSTNASNNSATKWIEAVIRTTDVSTVKSAREFVRELCIHELTPKRLVQLAKIYRPPTVSAGTSGEKRPNDSSSRPTIPPLLMVQLSLVNYPREQKALRDEGMVVAKTRQKRAHAYVVDHFRILGKCRYVAGDCVMQVTQMRSGKRMVAPAGNVLYVKSKVEAYGKVSFVYVERPDTQRKDSKILAKAIGHAQEPMTTDGLIKKKAFAQALFTAWNRK